MELYTRVQDLLFGVLLVSIGVMFIISIFKRDFNKFLVNIIMCGVAALFVKDPNSFLDILYFIKDFIMELLGKGV